MATVPAEVQGPSDAELIDAVRKGTLSAYGELYERHRSAAYNLARQLSRSQAQADDLVSDAFAKVLETLKTGRGPDSAFRAPGIVRVRREGRVLTVLSSAGAERIIEEARALNPVSVNVVPVTLKEIFLETVAAED